MKNLHSGAHSDADFYRSLTKDIPKLTRKQEKVLACRLKSNPEDAEAREKLIYHNLDVAIAASYKYVGCGVPFSDLIQEGNIGVIQAVNTFSPDSGTRFSTYAYCAARHSIFKAIAQKSRLVWVPNKTRALSTAVRNGNIPSEEVLKSKLRGLGLSSVGELESLSTNREFSLDREFELPYAGTGKLSDIISDPRSLTAFKEVDDRDHTDKLMGALNGVLSTLKPKDRDIVELAYGLNGKSVMPMKTIGKKYGCSDANISHRRLLSEAKLRRMLGKVAERVK